MGGEFTYFGLAPLISGLTVGDKFTGASAQAGSDGDASSFMMTPCQLVSPLKQLIIHSDMP